MTAPKCEVTIVNHKNTLEQGLVAFANLIEAIEILKPMFPDPDGVLDDTLAQAKQFFMTMDNMTPEDRDFAFASAPRLELIAADGRSGLLLNDQLIMEATADDVEGMAMLQRFSRSISESLGINCRYLDCQATPDLDLDCPRFDARPSLFPSM
jgi:hypothetical protein